MIKHVDSSGLSIYAKFFESEDSLCIALTGIGRLYTLPDEDVRDAELEAGTFAVGLFYGDADDPQDTDQLITSFTFEWNGQNEVSAVSINSGGGTLRARLGQTVVNQQEFLEIIQGESKLLTFIVEGRFMLESFSSLNVKLADVSGYVVEKLDASITRVCEAFDVQVLRCTLTADDTDGLAAGLAKIEIAFDTQKARLLQAIKIIDKIESDVS